MSARKKLLLDAHLNGVAVPVSALRSTESCGIGEFLDLPLLGSWCGNVGLDLIQILPINDTGSNSSPYSAVSAFALHPAYIRLQRLPGSEHVAAHIESFKQMTAHRRRVDFGGVLAFKLEILRRLFSKDGRHRQELTRWVEANSWVRIYAVYKCLKSRNDQRGWSEWGLERDLSEDEIEDLWLKIGEEALFHAWVQYHLDRQLTEAVGELEKVGVYLKGDIPILMNVDSADVWAHRRYFDLNFIAGAPPDMYATRGQMWGFPTYKWDEMDRGDFAWWRNRLKTASRYYHAFRIDHVLGFFRIWSVPSTENTAVLGRYYPSSPLTGSEIKDHVSDAVPVHRLTEAWLSSEEAADRFGGNTDHALERYFVEHASGDYLLEKPWASEKAIEALEEEDALKSALMQCHCDRTFLELSDGGYAPAWFWRKSSGYLLGDEHSRCGIEDLVASFEERSKPIWLEMGRRLLHVVKEASDMLPCAEDLGVVPAGLPGVLSDLGILSLKIERWELDDNDALMDPSTFPFLSVSTPGVHDTTALRGWWEESGWNREKYCEDIGISECPPWLTPDTARAIIRRSLRSASAIRVFQIQDLFTLTLDLRTVKPEDERINTPGSVSDANWTYVLPISLEALPTHEISGILTGLIAATSVDSPGSATSTGMDSQ